MSRVLIVDDERNIRLLLRATLESDGYEVAEAANGADALDALRAAGRPFDLVVLDLNMPVLDGMGLLGALRAAPTSPSRRAPRVIVLTAYGSISAAVRATRVGALDFLEKPVTPAQLRAAVTSVLAQPEPATEPAARAPDGFDGVLARVRTALRASDIATAEELLLRAADLGQNLASYYNLVGLLYELRGQVRLARKFYGKAMGAAGTHAPAERNMRRLYELQTFNRTDILPALGDETPAGDQLAEHHLTEHP